MLQLAIFSFNVSYAVKGLLKVRTQTDYEFLNFYFIASHILYEIQSPAPLHQTCSLRDGTTPP